MKKRSPRVWIVTVVSLLAVVGLLGGVKAGQIGAMIAAGKNFSPPPESVTSAPVEALSWEEQRQAVATLVAERGVTLSAELPGAVRAIEFQSGSAVRRGAVLVRQDTSTEEAQLAAAEADASLARLNLDRAVSLREGGANTPAELDAAQARMKQAAAAVATLQATIAKKTIRAPFDGRISIRQVELGQVLAPGTPIASLQSVDPIHADFWLPQQALAEVRTGQRAHLHTDTFPGATWEGKVTTVNTEVDPTTRNVRVRATFPNTDGRLRPGMFARAEVLAEAPRDVLVIPATAVLFAPYGDSVFVLEEKKAEGGQATTVARQSFVRLGERRGDLVAVASGLEAGQTVVSSGAFKLRNGQAVVIHNELAPDAKAAPSPADH
jgi:membrane fusion protein (multidrug efflux system)